MKTNSTKRNIAIAALVLLAIGAGFLVNHKRTSDNNAGADTMSSTMISHDPADMTPAPVVTPVPDATSSNTADQATAQNSSTDASSQADADNAEASDNGNMKSLRKSQAVARNYRHRRFNAAPTGNFHSAYASNNNQDDIAYATSSTYQGNMPGQPSFNVTYTYDEDVKGAPNSITTQRSVSRRRMNDRGSGGLNFAPEIGTNLNGLYNNTSSDLLKLGFNAGVMFNIGLTDAFALQPGVRYIMKGNETKSTTEVEALELNADSKQTLSYVEVPVNIVYKFGDKVGKPRFMIGAGPYVSYLVHANDKVKSTYLNDAGDVMGTQYTNTDNTNSLKRLDYGVGGFIGCQMPRGFYAKAGTEWGFRDMNQDPSDGKMSDRNYNFLISIGYILGPQNKTY